MRLDADALRAALAGLPDVDGDVIARGKPIAARLCAFIDANRAASSIVDLYDWGFSVEFVLSEGEPRYWTVECLSPDDFRMYPGFENGETVTWANVWVRGSNLTVDELIEQLNDAAFRKDESKNA